MIIEQVTRIPSNTQLDFMFNSQLDMTQLLVLLFVIHLSLASDPPQLPSQD